MAFVTGQPWKYQPWNTEQEEDIGPFTRFFLNPPRGESGEYFRAKTYCGDFYVYSLNGGPLAAYDSMPDEGGKKYAVLHDIPDDVVITANRCYIFGVDYRREDHPKYFGIYCVIHASIGNDGIINHDEWTISENLSENYMTKKYDPLYRVSHFVSTLYLNKFSLLPYTYNLNVDRESGIIEGKLKLFNYKNPGSISTEYNYENYFTTTNKVYGSHYTHLSDSVVVYNDGLESLNGRNGACTDIYCDGTVINNWNRDIGDNIYGIEVTSRSHGKIFLKVRNRSEGNDRVYLFNTRVEKISSDHSRLYMDVSYAEARTGDDHLEFTSPVEYLIRREGGNEKQILAREQVPKYTSCYLCRDSLPEDMFIAKYSFIGENIISAITTGNYIYLFVVTSNLLVAYFDDYGEITKAVPTNSDIGIGYIAFKVNEDGSLQQPIIKKDLFYRNDITEQIYENSLYESTKAYTRIVPVITSNRLYFIFSSGMALSDGNERRFFRDVPFITGVWAPFKGGANSYIDYTYDDEKGGCVGDGEVSHVLKVSGSVRTSGGASTVATIMLPRLTVSGSARTSGSVATIMLPRLTVSGSARTSGSVATIMLPHLTVSGTIRVAGAKNIGNFQLPAYMARGSSRAVAKASCDYIMRINVEGSAAVSMRCYGNYTFPALHVLGRVAYENYDWVLRFKRPETL